MSSTQSEEAREIVNEVRQSYEKWLLEMLGDFRDDVMQHFKSMLAASTTSIQLQEQLLDAQEQLGTRHEDAGIILHNEIDSLFYGKDSSRKPVSFEELALVDDVEVNRFVRRARMVTSILNTHQAEVKLVEARLAGLQAMGADVNPQALSPGLLFEALQKALNVYGFSEEVRAAYVNRFDEICLPRFIEGYRLVNRLLEERGIALNLELKNIKSRQQQMRVPEEANHYVQKELVSALQQLNEKIAGSVPKIFPQGGLSRELNNVLDESVASADGQPEAGSQRSISLTHSRQIEYVEKIVSGIAHDSNIDGRVRELIGNLLVPLAILSIRDPELFSKPDHPGRILVRELTLFGQSSKEIIDRRIDEVRSLIRHVTIENGENVNTIAQAGESIWRICEQELERFVESSKRERKQRLSEMRLREAKSRVVLELREQLLDNKLPPQLKPVLQKLLGPWMVVRYLRYGHNSRPWLEALAYMRLTFLAIQPETDKRFLNRRLALRNHLIRTLKMRASRSTLPSRQVAELVASVEDFFNKLSEADIKYIEDGKRTAVRDVANWDKTIDVQEDDIADVPAMHESRDMQ